MLPAEISSANNLFVQQRKEWLEIAIDWETANRYAILDENQKAIGMFAERSSGAGDAFARIFLRSHRGFEIDLVNHDGGSVLRLSRKFFFFFSDLDVRTPSGELLGSVHRRFGFFYKKYDLKDASGRLFATIESPFWRLWTFPIVAASGQVTNAEIAKKWSGFLQEAFTNADTFRISFGQGSWTEAERAVILACAISIDFDFFENTQSSGGIAGLLDR